MKQKQPVYKRLDTAPVFYTDTSELSPELFVITEFPTKLTAGKNILKLRGNSTNLKPDSLLDIEILDYNNEPIYHESTTYIAEDRSRVISIYIYPNTPPGEARIILTTEAVQINGQQIPDKWKNVYNAKWIRKTLVNPTLANSSEIIFETLPTISIEEHVGVQLDRTYSTTQHPTYSTGKVSYQNHNDQPILLIGGGAFIRDMVGGTVTVTSPVNPTPTPYYDYALPPYMVAIKKVLSDNAILLETPYLIAANQSLIPHQFNHFDNSTYSIEYTSTPTYVATENSESFALLKIDNLEPATGDISRIKVFINNSGTVGTWEQVSDIELEETEIFVANTASVTLDKSIGYIDSQTTINTYYDAYIYDKKELLGTAAITYNTSNLNNSMYINSIDAAVVILKNKNSYKGTFLQNSKYKVTLDALGIGNSKVSVYMSGSAFNIDTTDRYNQELPITVGKKIGELDTTILGNRIDDHILSFTADNNGTAVLIFVLEKGDWYLSDIRTTSDNDPGYTPNYTRIRTLIPTAHKSDVQLNFKVEYYNVDGVKCKQVNLVNNIPWTGGNRYIDGEYSMLTGSLYVADSLNSGIGISGYSNTGFIRSLGYSGFDAGYPGFLLYSGSALGGALSKGIAYSGVGLELYASPSNYFRYSTRDNELDIRTNKIYIGNDSTFISASNGNLQISSSKFTIKANGDVSASNMHLNDVAYADAFVYTTAVVTNSNYAQYYENYTVSNLYITGSIGVTKSFTKLVLDGSKGGLSVSQVRLERQPDWPIGMIIPPGYEFQGVNGYNVTVENWALNSNEKFGAIYFANAVASGSNIYDYAIHCDMWDVAAPGFLSRNFTYDSIRGITSPNVEVYGENPYDIWNTYATNAVVARSQTYTIAYGTMLRFQRTTNGNTNYEFQDSFWQIVGSDDNRFARQYFGGLKLGNFGTIIGGNGSMGSRTADVHYSKPHGSAVLQLDSGSTTLGNNAGSGSVFIPPRISATRRDLIGDVVEGSVIYNITVNKLQVYDGAMWQDCF